MHNRAFNQQEILRHMPADTKTIRDEDLKVIRSRIYKARGSKASGMRRTQAQMAEDRARHAGISTVQYQSYFNQSIPDAGSYGSNTVQYQNFFTHHIPEAISYGTNASAQRISYSSADRSGLTSNGGYVQPHVPADDSGHSKGAADVEFAGKQYYDSYGLFPVNQQLGFEEAAYPDPEAYRGLH